MMSVVGLLVGMVVGCCPGRLVMMRPARKSVPVSVVVGVVALLHTSKWVVVVERLLQVVPRSGGCPVASPTPLGSL